MNPLVPKLRALEHKISDEKGPFLLFALLLREDAPNKWDLVVSADWLERNQREGMKYLSRQVLGVLTEEELLMLSRIVILEQDNPGVKYILKTIAVEHGQFEMSQCTLFGMEIEEAYIITSKRPGFQRSGQAV